MYNIKTKVVRCYLWHEGIASRGSNEIASNVFDFLIRSDNIGSKKVSFFADGCSGQNKNSIMPAMLLNFISQSKFIEEVTLHFFETNHGQNEGDSVHSTIERAIKRTKEITLPSELSMLVKMSRRDPYFVKDVCTSDILDWKNLSQQMGILRLRVSEEGDPMVWTSVMQLRVKKNEHAKIFFKLSHLQKEFSTLNLLVRRNFLDISDPIQAYASPPKLSAEKYVDLSSLCSGQFPVIRSEMSKEFFLSLPHQ